MAVIIGGVTPEIQPAEVIWEPRADFGEDGNGAPIFGNLRSVRLVLPEMSRAQFEEWHNLLTGSPVTATLPREQDGDDTSYTTVYVRSVGARQSDVNMYGTEVLITNVWDPI